MPGFEPWLFNLLAMLCGGWQINHSVSQFPLCEMEMIASSELKPVKGKTCLAHYKYLVSESCYHHFAIKSLVTPVRLLFLGI